MPRPWHLFRVPGVMINAFDYLSGRHKVRRARNLLGYGGPVFCDSGGFQILTRNADVAPREIVEIQLALGADLNAALDNAVDARVHLQNLKVYQRIVDKTPAFDFVPVIPFGFSKQNVLKIRDLAREAPVVAVGNLVPSLFPLRGNGVVQDIVEFLVLVRGLFDQSKIHAFGVGGAATLLILAPFIDSTDSSSWLHDARFGKVRFLGGGVADTRRRHTVRSALASGPSCRCPACRAFGRAALFSRTKAGFQLRAVHNAWVCVQEANLVNRALAAGSFEALVRKRTAVSPWHRHLADAVLRATQGQGH